MKDKITATRISYLHPAIIEEVIRLIDEVEPTLSEGTTIRIVQGLRTFAEQDALYYKRPKVTNAKGGQSIHNYGLAIDICLIKNGKVSWEVDSDWMKVINHFKAAGYVWGGDWKTFKDYPHLEKSFGLGWPDLLKRYKAGQFIPGNTQYVSL